MIRGPLGMPRILPGPASRIAAPRPAPSLICACSHKLKIQMYSLPPSNPIDMTTLFSMPPGGKSRSCGSMSSSGRISSCGSRMFQEGLLMRQDVMLHLSTIAVPHFACCDCLTRSRLVFSAKCWSPRTATPITHSFVGTGPCPGKQVYQSPIEL